MKNKGVTLIALAVTIVVMLILAGVTISVLNGENGIVKQAQKAKEESKIKELKEKVRIDIAGKRVENINGELRVSVLKEILDKYFDNVPVETQITSETELKAKEEYGKYHATNEGGYISWCDFAKEIFRQAGMDVNVIPVSSAEYPAKAKRPSNSRMEKKKLEEHGFTRLPDWKDALGRYLKEIM